MGRGFVPRDAIAELASAETIAPGFILEVAVMVRGCQHESTVTCENLDG